MKDASKMRGNPLCGSNRISSGIARGLGAAADSFIVWMPFLLQAAFGSCLNV